MRANPNVVVGSVARIVFVARLGREVVGHVWTWLAGVVAILLVSAVGP
jgi:hypothetical protein